MAAWRRASERDHDGEPSSRRPSTDRRSSWPSLITACVVAWGYLVYLAIDFGTAARSGESSAWGLLVLSSLGAVACLFAGLLFVSRLLACSGHHLAAGGGAERSPAIALGASHAGWAPGGSLRSAPAAKRHATGGDRSLVGSRSVLRPSFVRSTARQGSPQFEIGTRLGADSPDSVFSSRLRSDSLGEEGLVCRTLARRFAIAALALPLLLGGCVRRRTRAEESRRPLPRLDVGGDRRRADRLLSRSSPRCRRRLRARDQGG